MTAPLLVGLAADTDHHYTAMTPAAKAACNRRTHHRSHPAMPNSTIERARDVRAAADADNRTARVEPDKKAVQSATEDMPDQVVSLVRRGELLLDIRRADIADLPIVLEFIAEAKLWLPSKHTNQWQKDWADQQGRKRSDRARDSLVQRTTWIVTVTYKNQSYAVATVTIELNANPRVWSRPGDLDDSAIYLSRLVVARRFAGLKIGAAVLNWVCDYARYVHHTERVRIDVWTRNFALHEYYRKQGFQDAGKCPDKFYPSGALFQRSTRRIIKVKPHIQPDLSYLGRAMR